MLGEFNFHGIKSYTDLGFTISNVLIGNPSPNLILESVPYMNGTYDFSEIDGNVHYSTREINVSLKLKKYEEYQYRLNALYYNVINKLLTNTMQKLTFSWIEGYFNARITNISDFNLLETERELQITFIAQPFRTYETYENEIKWDDFCFERDAMQGYYDVEDLLEFTLINFNENTVKPVIICSSDMTLTEKRENLSFDYSLTSGTNKDIVTLRKGENYFQVEGTGTIEFKWYREVI